MTLNKKKLDMKSLKKAKGFSLIELLLVIGFIAGALVLAFITYPKVQATSRANTTSQQMTLITAGVKNLYATAKNFGSLNLTVMENAKLLPDDMARVGGSTITSLSNVWGGDLLLAPTNSNRHFTITLTSVPQAECVKLATGIATNFIKLGIGSGSGAAEGNIFDRTVETDAVDVDPGRVTIACAAQAGGSTMIFTSN